MNKTRKHERHDARRPRAATKAECDEVVAAMPAVHAEIFLLATVAGLEQNGLMPPAMSANVVFSVLTVILAGYADDVRSEVCESFSGGLAEMVERQRAHLELAAGRGLDS